jgi:hypothetical protein
VPIDYNALKDGAAAQVPPPDGDHTALLNRAALVETQNGERLVTEWQDASDSSLQWTSWNRFDATGMSYTRELLMGLGIDLSGGAIMDDSALTDALDAATNRMYDVKTTSQMGSRGDRVFVTTYVDGLALGSQQALATDVPIDTRGLPAAQPPTPAAPAGGSGKPWEDDTPPF